MDERKLTAWLIMEGFLSPNQVKEALEEQLRLKRDGSELDIIEVARRKGMISDVQVLTVLEKTGYKPPAPVEPSKPASSPDLPAGGPSKSESGSGWGSVASGVDDSVGEIPAKYMADESAPVIPAQYAADSSEKIPSEYAVYAKDPGAVSTKPEPAQGKKMGESDSVTSRKRRSSGSHGLSSAASHAAATRRKSDAAMRNMLVAGAFLVPVLIALVLVSSGSGKKPVDTGKQNNGGGTTDAGPDYQALLLDLNASLDRLQASDEKRPGRKAEIDRLWNVLRKLKAAKLLVSQGRLVAKAEDRLRDVSGLGRKGAGLGGGGLPPLTDAEKKARAEAAWANLAQNFERILWLSLQQPRSELQLGAESVRGVDLRKKIMGEIPKYSAKGPDGIAALVGSEQLHPILGVGGYASLLRETNRFPLDLQESERWKKWKVIIPRFEELQKLARAYASATRDAEDASERGDLPAALEAFQHAKYKDDTWFAAVRKYLGLPAVVAAFRQRAKEYKEGTPIVRRGRLLPKRRGGTATAWGRNWKERFKHLARLHKKAKEDSEKASIANDQVALLGETLDMARGSFQKCREIVGFYDAHPKPFKREPKLRPDLKKHHELYFAGAFAMASGPETYRALDRWCSKKGYEAWRAKLRPFLRLVAAANNRKARAREGKRRARAGAKVAVAKFAETRLGNVAKGLAGVLAWMRKRGYAPASAKKEMDGIISRAVERAGDPVTGGRLRNDLAAIEHSAEAGKGSSEAKAYRKQVDNVIKEAVDRSLKAVKKCLAAREPGLAFDLFQYVLQLDPENNRAHKGLGHVKVRFRGEDKWMRRFDATRLKAGFRWDRKLGWVRHADEERYEGGEYYDLQTKSWTTVAQANQAHADANNPWIVKTEHFELRSTADLPITTRVAERLEAFYLQLFRQYDLFFLGKGGAELIFGMSPSQSKPLVVNFYRTRDQFKQHANPPTDWAAGFYSGGKHASFFYASGGWTTLQHEIVHQILGETSPGGGGDAWLAEGAAVYLENAFFRDGVLTLGSRRDHRRIMAYQYNERANGKEHKLLDMLKFKTGRDWDSGDIGKNYRGAGAVVYFLCHFDDGRYKSDFIEYLKAAYYGQNPRLEDFFGMPAKVLDALMRRFYDPKAKVAIPGGGTVSVEDLTVAVDAFTKSCKGKKPDLDQLSEAYGMLRKSLGGSSGKEADKSRKKAGRALISMRNKLARQIEKEIKAASHPKTLVKRRARLKQLQEKALAIIYDKQAYPDANHGKAGQHLVDKEVGELQRFWDSLPPVFEKDELKPAVEILRTTEPWLDELAPKTKRRGKTLRELKAQLKKRAGCENLVLTGDDKKAYDYNQKVRTFNANQTDIPPDARQQAKVLNDYRIMLGRHALALDTRLYQCAAKHSAWMESAGNMTHDEPSPARRTPSKRAKLEGYNDPVSENVAFGYSTPEAVHKGWYTSSGHHRNMCSKQAWVIGVARSGTYWTQVFGWAKPALN